MHEEPICIRQHLTDQVTQCLDEVTEDFSTRIREKESAGDSSS